MSQSVINGRRVTIAVTHDSKCVPEEFEKTVVEIFAFRGRGEILLVNRSKEIFVRINNNNVILICNR